MQFLKNININFIDKRKMGYLVSAILITVSVVSLVLHGGPKYNVDFTGGTIVQLKFQENVVIEEVRTILSTHGFGDAEIKHFGYDDEIMIRVGLDNQDEEAANKIEDAIRAELSANPFVVQRVEKVGPKIGHELIIDALLAIFWAMVLILFYVMWRFEFKFSIGAILAILHDITITLGVFSVFEIEVSAPIIAAVLTIVGYSLNDTIVVFDRIRENMKASKKNLADIAGTVNRSVNETLSRTVVTSLTTLIVVFVLYLFGGEVLRSFAFALIIGIIIGTYSSIFIASPVVVDWKSKKA